MSKTKTLAAIISGWFPQSEKAISEKLSGEEHATFSEDVNKLNAQLEEKTAAHELVVADLETANAQVANLTTRLATAEASLAAANTTLAATTKERDTYKGHYDRAKAAGTLNADEDESSRGKSEMTSYNAHALEAFNKANGKIPK